ncbi:MAG: PstS family phosphate ABC transporter substrate-binding protein [Pseudomonadota bacterium]|nr:PstS family phosphate ABC transporter substrate-binding protein [Pseudomonadota bacterium]
MNSESRLLPLCLTALLCTAVSANATTLIRAKGSDTMIHVAQIWAEAYEAQARDVAVSVGGGGSGTGFHAMLLGTVDLVNASRRMGTEEAERAQALGMNPVEHIVGYDALAVYLHKDNPLKSITYSQLAQIFGRGGEIRNWSDLGVEVPGCKGQEIVRVGRQSSSGTYVYFRSAIMKNQGRYDLGILDMLSSKDVVQMVEKTPCAIGYSGLAYATPRVNMACVAEGETAACVVPSIASASDKSYPIARPLFVYSKQAPIDEIKSYLDWILGNEGQCILKNTGYAPVRAVECD